MSSLKGKGSSRVQSNLLQQNCFVRDCSLKSDLNSDSSSESSYLSFVEKVVSNGTTLELHSFPYPITPHYVDSFVDSTDYRVDPLGSVANSVKRKNLGDIRAMQDVSKMDSDQARVLYSQLSERFKAASDKVASDKVASDKAASDINS